MACATCAQTKAKCDQQNPCGRCQAKGITCHPRTKRRAWDGVGSSAESSSLNVQLGAESRLVDVVLEDNTTLMDQDAPSREAQQCISRANSDSVPPAPTDELILLPTPDPATQPVDLAADSVQNTPIQNTVTSKFVSKASLVNHVDNIVPRTINHPLLPQLDWQTLANTGAQYSNSDSQLAVVDQIDQRHIEKPGWNAFDVVQSEAEDFVGGFMPSTDNLFSFNAEQSSWQSSLSALDRIMADYFKSLGPSIPQEGDALWLASQNLHCGSYHEPSPTNSQDWSSVEPKVISDVVMAEEELDKWALGQCTRVAGGAVTYASPEEDPMHQGYPDTTTWSCAVERYRDSCYEAHERIENVDLTDETRDRMLLVAQNLIRTSMESHDAKQLSGILSTNHSSTERCLLLPPKSSLQKYLDIFLTTFEPFTPMIPAISLDPNKLACQSSEHEATLLLFLMIAFGSMIDPAPRARRFSHELTEVCRSSLRKVGDIGGVARRDILTMHCGLIFAVQTSFSGRRSHMEVGRAQRHLYIAVWSNVCYNVLPG